MLNEALAYITTPASATARRLGYLKEAIAIEARHQRVVTHWKEHLERSQEYVWQSAKLCKKTRHAVILGSGLLLDVPLARLSAHFDRVTCVDIVHLKKVRHNLSHYDNVELYEHDITGVADTLVAYISEDSAPEHLPVSRPSCPCIDESTDFVVSLNLLSQLSVVPACYVRDKFSKFDNQIRSWKKQITQNHIEWLTSLPCRTCLISDVQRLISDKEGEIKRTEDSLHGATLPPTSDTWWWDIIPLEESDTRESCTSLVWAYSSFSRTSKPSF